MCIRDSPLADHFISQDEAAQNGEFLRPTYQATVDFIVNDLNNAIELLPNVYLYRRSPIPILP